MMQGRIESIPPCVRIVDAATAWQRNSLTRLRDRLGYVKANDLEKYRVLWHESFVGWPFVSSAPVRKDHITDWITANTSKGIKLQSYSIEQLAIHVTGKIAINYYRIRANWANDEGTEAKTDTLRIMHTWIRAGATWQIIGGMSAPLNANGQ